MFKSYTITLFHSQTEGMAKSWSVMRESDEEAIDVAKRALRSHVNTTAQHAIFDSWSVMASPGRGRLPVIIATGRTGGPPTDDPGPPPGESWASMDERGVDDRGPNGSDLKRKRRSAWDKLGPL
jgi:hypothetical protein